MLERGEGLICWLINVRRCQRLQGRGAHSRISVAGGEGGRWEEVGPVQVWSRSGPGLGLVCLTVSSQLWISRPTAAARRGLCLRKHENRSRSGGGRRPARDSREPQVSQTGEGFPPDWSSQGSRQLPLPPPSHTLPPAASEWEFSAGAGSKVTSLLIGLTLAGGASGTRRGAPIPDRD